MKNDLEKNESNYIGTIVLVAFVLFLISYLAYRVELEDALKDTVVNIEFFSEDHVLLENRLKKIDGNIPENTEYARINLDITTLKSKSIDDALYLYVTPIKSPIRFLLNRSVMASYGDFFSGTLPRVQDILLPIRDTRNSDSLAIEIRLSSITGKEFDFLRQSGFGRELDLSIVVFVRNFITSYGFIALGVLFMAVSGMLYFLRASASIIEGIEFLILAMMSQAWVSLYFSRFLFELPIESLHQVSFIVYFLGFTSFQMFAYFQIKGIFLRSILLIQAILGIAFSIVIGYLSVFYHAGTVFTAYKSMLVIIGGCWISWAVSLIAYRRRVKIKEKRTYTAICIGASLIALGQLNDISRAFNQDLFLYNIGPYAVVTAALIILSASVKTIQNRYLASIANERQLAIANTTQMLAHDIRKPFSLLKSSMLFIESITTMKELQESLPTMKNALDRSLISVEGMIKDVLELGKGADLFKESYSPKKIVRDALEEVVQMHTKVHISVDYSWNHQSKINIDASRVQRVFSNIINNAVQAMKGKGKIWIKTAEINDFVLFTIGNEGSFISPESCEKLFDAFFTSGKKGGTGLGLAIAKKITEAHGGKIYAKSNKSEQIVEFCFSLPIHSEVDSEVSATMPFNLCDFKVIKIPSTMSTRRFTIEQEEKIARVSRLVDVTNNQIIRLALIDDENLYREGVISLVKGTVLYNKIHFYEFATAQEVLAFDPSNFDFVICDVDLGDHEFNGYDIIKALTQDRRFKGAACIHSNKALTQDFQMAAEAGAKGFQPKPMTLDYLLKFILDNPTNAANHICESQSGVASIDKNVINHLGTENCLKPVIAFVDDDKFLRKLFPMQVKDAKVRTFGNPQEFWAYVDDPINLAILTCVISDNYFGDQSSITGIEFTKVLRRKFKGAIVLYSDGLFQKSELEHLDLHIPKGSFLSWEEISERLAPDSPALLRARLKSRVKANKSMSKSAKALCDMARHDLQAYVSSVEIAARLMKNGEADLENLRNMMLEKFTLAADFLSLDEVAAWRLPVDSLEYLQDSEKMQGWRLSVQKTLSFDDFGLGDANLFRCTQSSTSD